MTASNFPWLQWQQSILEETADHTRRVMRLTQLWQKAQRVKKGATPSEVVFEQDGVKLLHYVSDTPPKYKTPLLFVFALLNRPYILDLLPNKSVVRHFVDAGFDTYLIDWGMPHHGHRTRTLDDYVNVYLRDALEYLRERDDVDRINLLGYCM